MRRLLSTLRAFVPAARGNAAVMCAVALVPIIGFSGAAVDYARATRAHALTQKAVDAAALAGVQVLDRSDGEAARRATDVYLSMVPAAQRGVLPTVQISTNHTTISVEAVGSVPSTLAAILGTDHLRFTARSEAKRPDKRYIDVYLALDVSASMGLAASEAGRDQLRALTGCAFACHEAEGGQAISNYDVARANRIQTRFDILQEQTRNLARELLDPSNLNEVRFGMYTISDTAGRTLSPPSGTPSIVNNGIDRLQLAFNTHFDAALPVILQDMGAQGTGATSGSTQKLLFLVTDGVQSDRGMPWDSSGFRPIDVPLCNAFRDRGFQVAVLNIRYVPMPSEAPYNGTVGRFQDQLAPNLRACASSGFYYEADRPEEIAAGFARFTQALAQARLSR